MRRGLGLRRRSRANAAGKWCCQLRYFSIAPGGLASIFGSGLGPAAGVAGSAAGLSVSFNGLPAYILDSSAGQDNVQIPYEVRPGSANVVVEYQGHSSAPFAVTVLAYAPGFFSIRAAGGNVGLFQHANGAVVGGQSPGATR